MRITERYEIEMGLRAVHRWKKESFFRWKINWANWEIDLSIIAPDILLYL